MLVLPPALSPGSAEKSLSFVFAHTHEVFMHCDKISPKPALPQANQSHLSQPLVLGQMLQAFNNLNGPSFDPSPVYLCLSCTGMPSTAVSVRCTFPVLSRGQFCRY